MTTTARKFILVPAALAALGVAFAIVCLLLRLFGSRDSLVRKKLRIGAILLTLQGFALQGVTASASCYDAEMEPWIEPSSQEVGLLELSLSEPLVLEAVAWEVYGPVSFALMDGETIVQVGPAEAVDGAMDSYEEPVRIMIDAADVAPGIDYELCVYEGAFETPEAIAAAPGYALMDVYEVRFR
jgi:hypothetical protein